MATLYCGPSTTGNGSGSNFSNLLALPNTTGFTRGNTYIVVDGSYGSKTLSTANSGSTTITIKKASAADSAVTGYSSALHAGQATFGEITVQTTYWVMNGVTRTESNLWGAPSGYGFRASGVTANSLSGQQANYSEFSYMDLGATWATNPSAGTIAGYGPVVYLVYNQTGVKFSRCAIHNATSALVMAHGTNGLTLEYCHLANGWGKEAIAGPNVGFNNMVVRYCRFWNSTQTDPNDPTTGQTAEIGAFGIDVNPTGNLIYGNWFRNSISDQGRNSCIALGGLGFNGVASNCKVFNNTFAQIPDTSVYSMIYLYNGSGNEARNNLFYGCGSTGVTANSVSNNVTASVNPFVDYATLDLRITASNQARNVGTNVGAPYNYDPLGVLRGGDGTWDVGAYEYDSGTPTPPIGTPVLSVR